MSYIWSVIRATRNWARQAPFHSAKAYQSLTGQFSSRSAKLVLIEDRFSSLEVQAEISDCKNFDIESITISEKSSKTMDSLKALAGSIKSVSLVFSVSFTVLSFLSFRDACVAPGGEGASEHLYGGNGDSHGRKSSAAEQHSSTAHRASSPNSDKTVSFFDERSKSKSK